MFQVRVGSESLVYTGDYNMTPDRHLGAAWIGTIHILRKHLHSTKVNFLKNWFFRPNSSRISFSTLHLDEIFML